MMVGTCATRRLALRQLASGDMFSTSGSKLDSMLTAVRSTAMGWLLGGVRRSISTTWLGRRISATSSERKAASSAAVGQPARARAGKRSRQSSFLRQCRGCRTPGITSGRACRRRTRRWSSPPRRLLARGRAPIHPLKWTCCSPSDWAGTKNKKGAAAGRNNPAPHPRDRGDKSGERKAHPCAPIFIQQAIKCNPSLLANRTPRHPTHHSGVEPQPEDMLTPPMIVTVPMMISAVPTITIAHRNAVLSRGRCT